MGNQDLLRKVLSDVINNNVDDNTIMYARRIQSNEISDSDASQNEPAFNSSPYHTIINSEFGLELDEEVMDDIAAKSQILIKKRFMPSYEDFIHAISDVISSMGIDATIQTKQILA